MSVKAELLPMSHQSMALRSFSATAKQLLGIWVSKFAGAHQQINADFKVTLVKGFPLHFSPRCHFSLYIN